MQEVVVVGSANIDLLISVDQLPRPGETVLSSGMTRQSGGKGANQAVAAARLGAKTSFVGCVGDDHEGTLILNSLRSEGVGISDIDLLSQHPSGLDVVTVDREAENSITVVPGANSQLEPQRVKSVLQRMMKKTPIIVSQAEIPASITTEIASLVALHEGSRFILNLAPYRAISDQDLAACNPLVLNEAEAEALSESVIEDLDSALATCQKLAQKTISTVITLGAQGAVWSDGATSGHVPAPLVSTVVDTTGAGDAFVGALAAALAMQLPLVESVKRGVVAGSFAVSKLGAQTSYPTLEDLNPLIVD